MAIPPSQSGLIKFTTEPFLYTGTEGDEETDPSVLSDSF